MPRRIRRSRYRPRGGALIEASIILSGEKEGGRYE
jgi:hypothetical protein